MFLSRSDRRMLESTLYNLRHTFEHVGAGQDVREEISLMTDAELISALNDFIAAT